MTERILRLYGPEYAGLGHMLLLPLIRCGEQLGLIKKATKHTLFLNKEDFVNREALTSIQKNFCISNDVSQLGSSPYVRMKVPIHFVPDNISQTDAINLAKYPLSPYHIIISRLNDLNGLQLFNRFLDTSSFLSRDVLAEKFGYEGSRKLCVLHIRDTVWQPSHIRNNDVSAYNVLVSCLVNDGYSVVRIGHGHPLETREGLTDLYNIWSCSHELSLIYECDLYIGCPSGPSYLASIYNKPTMILNVLDPLIAAFMHDSPGSYLFTRSERKRPMSTTEIERSYYYFASSCNNKDYKNIRDAYKNVFTDLPHSISNCTIVDFKYPKEGLVANELSTKYITYS